LKTLTGLIFDADGHIYENHEEIEEYFEGKYRGMRRARAYPLCPRPKSQRHSNVIPGALSRVEALRTADRLRLTHEISDSELAELMREIQVVHEAFAIHPVTNRIF